MCVPVQSLVGIAHQKTHQRVSNLVSQHQKLNIKLIMSMAILSDAINGHVMRTC